MGEHIATVGHVLILVGSGTVLRWATPRTPPEYSGSPSRSLSLQPRVLPYMQAGARRIPSKSFALQAVQLYTLSSSFFQRLSAHARPVRSAAAAHLLVFLDRSHRPTFSSRPAYQHALRHAMSCLDRYIAASSLRARGRHCLCPAPIARHGRLWMPFCSRSLFDYPCTL